MNYKTLVQGINYFNSKFPPDRSSKSSYSNLRNRDLQNPGYWPQLYNLNEKQLGIDIIDGFLNPWKCRLDGPNKPVGQEMVHNLSIALAKLPKYCTTLVGLRIEDVNFQSSVSISGQALLITDIINSIYSIFLQIRPRFGRVAASKLMHMALPNLFVMWDNGIIEKYNIPKRKFNNVPRRNKDYVYFLMLMKENINHVISDFSKTKNMTRSIAIQNILKQQGNLTLPRLIDMANFAVRDSIVQECKLCNGPPVIYKNAI